MALAIGKTSPAHTARTTYRADDSGYFEHHGPWAPGVRLFRALHFTPKAVLISAVLMIPMVLLLFVYLQKQFDDEAFARSELQGVAVLKVYAPVMRSVVDLRNTTRAVAANPSLDASVDAARAGDQGRGFAVVASEVRNLAQRSALAAKEIKSLITGSVDEVASGTRVVEGAGDTMQELVQNAGRMNDLLAKISAKAREQSTGVGQVGASILELDHMTQKNAALVEHTEAAAESLRDQATNLSEHVSHFSMPEAA